MKIIAYDQFTLAKTPEQVAGFITNPAQVEKYYPLAIDVWQPIQHQLVCTGFMGGAIIEQVSSQPYAKRKAELADVVSIDIDDNALCIETKVYGIFWAGKQSSTDKLKANAFFTMFEDWILEADGNGGTRLLKIWRDLDKKKYTFLPLDKIIQQTAKKEHKHLAKAWN